MFDNNVVYNWLAGNENKYFGTIIQGITVFSLQNLDVVS